MLARIRLPTNHSAEYIELEVSVELQGGWIVTRERLIVSGGQVIIDRGERITHVLEDAYAPFQPI